MRQYCQHGQLTTSFQESPSRFGMDIFTGLDFGIVDLAAGSAGRSLLPVRTLGTVCSLVASSSWCSRWPCNRGLYDHCARLGLGLGWSPKREVKDRYNERYAHQNGYDGR